MNDRAPEVHNCEEIASNSSSLGDPYAQYTVQKSDNHCPVKSLHWVLTELATRPAWDFRADSVRKIKWSENTNSNTRFSYLGGPGTTRIVKLIFFKKIILNNLYFRIKILY